MRRLWPRQRHDRLICCAQRMLRREGAIIAITDRNVVLVTGAHALTVARIMPTPAAGPRHADGRGGRLCPKICPSAPVFVAMVVVPPADGDRVAVAQHQPPEAASPVARRLAAEGPRFPSRNKILLFRIRANLSPAVVAARIAVWLGTRVHESARRWHVRLKHGSLVPLTGRPINANALEVQPPARARASLSGAREPDRVALWRVGSESTRQSRLHGQRAGE